MVEIKTRVKQVGKRKDFIEEKRYSLRRSSNSLEGLITEIVEKEVLNFNENKSILRYLTEEEVEERASIGKVDFSDRKNQNKQDLQSAISNAILSFRDGIYLVFINGEQKEDLEEVIELENEDEVLFIRLLMLAGRLW